MYGLLALLLTGCGKDGDSAAAGDFTCGADGGSCDGASELCLLSADGCSSCVALPDACAAGDGCACLADEDMSTWSPACAGDSTCSSEGGLTVQCYSSDFACG